MWNQFGKAFVDYLKRADIILWLLLAGISTYSLLLLKSVSRATPDDYFRTQVMAIGLGVCGAVFVSLMDYADLAGFWKLITGFSIFLMIYTYFFGERIQGSGGVDARAWIQILGRTFQTSELVKVAFMITYAKHLDMVKSRGRLDEFPQVVLLGCHALVFLLLCQLQGDTGATVVFFFMFVAMSLAAGVQLRYFAILAGMILVGLPLAWRYIMPDYQKARFIAVFNLDDPDVRLQDGYQQWQGRISIGSGKLKGQGLFEGSRVASNVVVFQQSDFIFSVAGEELGFIGCVLIMVLLLLFMLKVLHVAGSARDELGRFICYGYFGWIALQSVANIGMCVAMLPAMGVTLPFFSAGGSSAACLYLGFGLVQSVHMRRREIDGLHLKQKSPLRFAYKQGKVGRELRKM
ncbi:FtsW/RodA/SpoVE family cell cycle protein [Oscillospiraceae bacterium 42-9]|uniref:FtsW/RodA/SpoVE family cell cycle protein n=1 Tax=Acutalibacter sp. TaxID=1918636 RepID=UPI002171442C|nr:FtsW/RodA/SpoVE family cell cycle protein [Acutalibacter sp.]